MIGAHASIDHKIWRITHRCLPENHEIAGMNLNELLHLHRAHYLDYFKKCLAPVEDGYTEILLETESKAPDELFRNFRADGVVPDDIVPDGDRMKVADFELRSSVYHEPFVQYHGESSIEIRPFPWNYCVVQVVSERFDRAALIAWGLHWIDIEDMKFASEDERIKGVIHYISAPTYPGGKLAFVVDFGTAPVRAATELIQVLTIGAGEYRVILGPELPFMF